MARWEKVPLHGMRCFRSGRRLALCFWISSLFQANLSERPHAEIEASSQLRILPPGGHAALMKEIAALRAQKEEVVSSWVGSRIVVAGAGDEDANGVYESRGGAVKGGRPVFVSQQNKKYKVQFSTKEGFWMIDVEGGAAPYKANSETKSQNVPLKAAWSIYQGGSRPAPTVREYGEHICIPGTIQRRRRADLMCTCRRRQGKTNLPSGWMCGGDTPGKGGQDDIVQIPDEHPKELPEETLEEMEGYDQGAADHALTALNAALLKREIDFQINTTSIEDGVFSQLLHALKDTDSDVRLEATKAIRELKLSRSSAKATSVLVGLVLRDAEQSTRWNAVKALDEVWADAIVTALTAALVDSKFLTRQYAAEALSDSSLSRHASASVVALTSTMLEDPEITVRRRASKALCRLGERASDSIPLLMSTLQDKESEVRCIAAFTLACLSPTDVETLPALKALLQDTNPQTRACAAGALGKLGFYGSGAIDDLMQALKDKVPNVREMAATALGQLGLKSVDALPELMKALQDPMLRVRSQAAKALGNLGPLASGATQELTTALISGRGWSTEPAYALAKLGPTAGVSIRLLIGGLGNPIHRNVRFKCAVALQKFGTQAVGASEDLVDRCLQDIEERVRREACIALNHLGDRAEKIMVVPKIQGVLNDKKEEIDARENAANALAILGDTARDALPDLIDILNDPTEDPELRLAAAKAIGIMGPNVSVPVQAINTLKDRAQEEAAGDRKLQVEILSILGILLEGRPAHVFAGQLTKLLSLADTQTRHYAEVRSAAALALGKLGREKAQIAIPTLQDHLRRDKDAVVRAMSAKALGKLASLANPGVETKQLADPLWTALKAQVATSVKDRYRSAESSLKIAGQLKMVDIDQAGNGTHEQEIGLQSGHVGIEGSPLATRGELALPTESPEDFETMLTEEFSLGPRPRGLHLLMASTAIFMVCHCIGCALMFRYNALPWELRASKFESVDIPPSWKFADPVAKEPAAMSEPSLSAASSRRPSLAHSTDSAASPSRRDDVPANAGPAASTMRAADQD